MNLQKFDPYLNISSENLCAYQKSERHLHRYGFNNVFREIFKEKGMLFSTTSFESKIIEAIELTHLSWFVACKFRAKFKSRPSKSHLLFKWFIKAAKNFSRELQFDESNSKTAPSLVACGAYM